MRFQTSLYELPETGLLWLAKGIGAVLGSAISIAYILPTGRREAAIRFIVGVILGITFGPTIGLKINNYLEIGEQLSRIEEVLMGATAASLCAWWALGILKSLFTSKIKQQS